MCWLEEMGRFINLNIYLPLKLGSARLEGEGKNEQSKTAGRERERDKET